MTDNTIKRKEITMNNCGSCKKWKCRCADCPALIEREGQWYCEEEHACCEDVKECKEYEAITGCEEGD